MNKIIVTDDWVMIQSKIYGNNKFPISKGFAEDLCWAFQTAKSEQCEITIHISEKKDGESK